MLDRTHSPKLTTATRRTALYHYYAGFSEEFVRWALKQAGVSNEELVLDPWNGAGTTTAVCAHQGISSIGVDINPAMRPIASTRSMSRERIEEVAKVAARSLSEAELRGSVSPFTYCKAVYDAASKHCHEELHDGLRFGLMAACRALARSVRSKNPTWHSIHALRSLSVSADIIDDEIRSSFDSLLARATNIEFGLKVSPPTLLTGNWDRLRWRRRVSHVITSPPYLTRIDYVMKTLPELLYLEQEQKIDLISLRRQMLGSVLTKSTASANMTPKSHASRAVLSEIEAHHSKASSTYYYRFFCTYLSRIEASLRNFSDPRNAPKTITIVSQGSFYKEIFVDLPLIISDVLSNLGYCKVLTQNFTSAHHMATVNSRSLASELPPPPEVAAIYRRLR